MPRTAGRVGRREEAAAAPTLETHRSRRIWFGFVVGLSQLPMFNG